jgi:hypothetical protein
MSAETTAQLDRSKVYVVYCDGIGYNASTKGAYKLAGLGFHAKELLGGIDWWRRDVSMRRSGDIAVCSSRSPASLPFRRKWDQRFESAFLQRRVCKPPVPEQSARGTDEAVNECVPHLRGCLDRLSLLDTMPPGKMAIDALRLMEDGRYRHLPIVDDGKVVGIVSRFDFSGIELDRLDEETGLWERI